MDVLSEYENDACLAAFSDWEQLNLPRKQGRLDQMSGTIGTTSIGITWSQLKIVDAAALVHTLEPKDAPTISKAFKRLNADNGFMPYLFKQLRGVRLDRCCVGLLHCWQLEGTHQIVPWYWTSFSCIWENTSSVKLEDFFAYWLQQNRAFPVSCFSHWICSDTWRKGTCDDKRRNVVSTDTPKRTSVLWFIASIPTSVVWTRSWSMPPTWMYLYFPLPLQNFWYIAAHTIAAVYLLVIESKHIFRNTLLFASL